MRHPSGVLCHSSSVERRTSLVIPRPFCVTRRLSCSLRPSCVMRHRPCVLPHPSLVVLHASFTIRRSFCVSRCLSCGLHQPHTSNVIRRTSYIPSRSSAVLRHLLSVLRPSHLRPSCGMRNTSCVLSHPSSVVLHASFAIRRPFCVSRCSCGLHQPHPSNVIRRTSYIPCRSSAVLRHLLSVLRPSHLRPSCGMRNTSCVLSHPSSVVLHASFAIRRPFCVSRCSCGLHQPHPSNVIRRTSYIPCRSSAVLRHLSSVLRPSSYSSIVQHASYIIYIVRPISSAIRRTACVFCQSSSILRHSLSAVWPASFSPIERHASSVESHKSLVIRRLFSDTRRPSSVMDPLSSVVLSASPTVRRLWLVNRRVSCVVNVIFRVFCVVHFVFEMRFPIKVL